MIFKLAYKEMIRGKGRFLAVALIVALVTVLVLFEMAMAEGLTLASSQYIAGMDAELVIFRDKSKMSIPASNLGSKQLNDIERVEGVEAVGPIGFSTATLIAGGKAQRLEVSLIGVEPGKPGAPDVLAGRMLSDDRANEVVIDQNVLDQVNFPVGSIVTIEVVQGVDEKVYPLTVVGHTAGKKYNMPSIFVPLRVWNKIKPQERRSGGGEIVFNVAAVKLLDPASGPRMAKALEGQISHVQVTDLTTAYESLPGYRDMQSVISILQNFIILVAMLVIGGFFQIQALQKMAQVGMLKAIGASSRLVVSTLLTQVMTTILIGMLIGIAAVWGLSASLPPTIPIVFNGPKVLMGLATLLLMGPFASFVAVRTLLKVEPLKALGLAR